MGLEIERKFLIEKDKWSKFNKPDGEFYRQGYISTDPTKTIRVRLTDRAAYLTIKGSTVGAARHEFEYTIPKEDAKDLLNNFAISEIIKIRYIIPYENKIWEIDEFKGDNEGLIVAEIELTREDEVFAIPPWIGKEVTTEAKYYNSNLSKAPYNTW